MTRGDADFARARLSLTLGATVSSHSATAKSSWRSPNASPILIPDSHNKANKKRSRSRVQAIMHACTRLRDRFLFALLWESGIRIGEALGLRHEDLAVAECELTVAPRVNDNRARAKSASPRVIPLGPAVVRLYGDYLH